MLIDSHCHVLSSEYDNVDYVIKESFDAGVDKIIINGYDLQSSIEAVSLAAKYSNVYAAIGIGPENIDNLDNDYLKSIKSLLQSKKVVAIGEIGLDYYWTKDTKDIQINVFKSLLNVAVEHNLPVIVHNRDATNDVIKLLKEYKVVGIIHCFSGSLETAKELIKLGFLIGIGGVITFKNSKKLVDTVKNIPISSISLETDSPYLTPEPHRGHKNSPKEILYIARKVAELKDVSVDEVLHITGDSVGTIFDL